MVSVTSTGTTTSPPAPLTTAVSTSSPMPSRRASSGWMCRCTGCCRRPVPARCASSCCSSADADGRSTRILMRRNAFRPAAGPSRRPVHRAPARPCRGCAARRAAGTAAGRGRRRAARPAAAPGSARRAARRTRRHYGPRRSIMSGAARTRARRSASPSTRRRRARPPASAGPRSPAQRRRDHLGVDQRRVGVRPHSVEDERDPGQDLGLVGTAVGEWKHRR